jgi:aspartyl/glutamyl-tRNA(Asn/Gln) amidotransferase C subunit
MTTPVDIGALAKLARLEVSDAEMASLEQELPGILAFVETIQNAAISEDVRAGEHRNVFREDENAHEGGIYTEDLLNAAPAREKNRIAVKQVISRKSSQGGPTDRK